MSNSTGSTKSTGIILGAAALLLGILLYFAFGRGDQKPEPVEATKSAARTEAPPRERAVPTPAADRRGSAPAPARTADARRAPSDRIEEADGDRDQELRYQLEDAQQMPESIRRDFEEGANPRVPAHVQDAFDNPYAPISDRDMELIRENQNPVLPEHIQQQIDAATHRKMPADVKAAFENPYVEAPEEYLQQLREAEGAARR